jgi:DNA-binding transcriptional LysR family regulator
MESLAPMRLFVATVRGGSFSEAARQVGCTPSAVSRQVGALEADLGVRLFTRTTRRLNLTEAGAKLYEQSERILGEIEEMREAVRAVDSRPRGLLSVTAPVVYSRLHLAPRLPKFLARYPEVHLNVVLSDTVVDLVENDIDVAVRIAALPDSTLIARRIASVTRVICASPDYLERRGKPITASDLRDHDCLPFRFHTAANAWRAGSNIWRLQGGDALHEISVAGPFTANNADVLVTAALAGLGLILVPTWLVSDHLDDGSLVPVLGDYQVSPSDVETAVYAVYPSGRFLSPKVRAFIDFLVESLGHGPANE